VIRALGLSRAMPLRYVATMQGYAGKVSVKSESPSFQVDRGIKRLSLPEVVAESLQQRILTGEFKEGDTLVQETLAIDYKVSRMPIREALRQLEGIGLVVMQMHKGAIVTSLPIEQIGELFDLRSLLEGDLLRHSMAKMKKSHLDEARRILHQLEEAYRLKKIDRWGELNWQFHRSLYVAADRTQTLALVQTVNIQTDRYIRLQLLLTGAILDAESDHRKLVRLCAAKEAEPAVRFLREHIRKAASDLLRVISENRATNATRLRSAQ
jgi:DNA-binding GntR family transcriptional regulator